MFASGKTEIVQVRRGWPLKCHPAAYRCAYSAQSDDPEQIAEFDSFLRTLFPGTVLFDIGAHFGLFSLAALHYGGLRAQAIAIDPSPVATRFLNIQAGLNDVADRLRVIEATVGDRVGRQSMIPVGVLASGYYVAPTEGYPNSELAETRAITLDWLVEELATLPSHVKIDVEGDEAAVLRGGQQLFSPTSAPILFIELHNEIVRRRGERPTDVLALLRAYGYQTFAVDGSPISDEAILIRSLIRIVARKSSATTTQEEKSSG
jgi:FkbM family methyltransferase